MRIAKAWAEAGGVRAMELVPAAAGAALPAPSAGCHLDLHLPNGLVRQYSVCNGPDERGFYRIAVKLEERSRGGSRSVHNDLAVGDLVAASAPRNHFPIAEVAEEHLLLAGGIGITPILAMGRALAHAGRRFRLLYFVRSLDAAAFRAEIDGPSLAGHATILAGLDVPATRAALGDAVGGAHPRAHLYACGPTPFMDAALAAARAAGWSEDRLHREHFSAPVAAAGERFAVEARRSGAVVEVGADETIVAALARAGVIVDVSCEQGICGTCLTPVLAGEPDHRDSYLTDEEKLRNDQMCLCVSRAISGRIVLDV